MVFLKAIRYRFRGCIHSFRDWRCQRAIKHRVYDARDLFFMENRSDGFNRYDIIVRLLAVEDYHGLNEYGFRMYEKMQAARMGEAWVNPAVDRFKKLIQSYDENGYDKASEIKLDKNLHLLDGSHRMAMALYYHTYAISCKVFPTTKEVRYGLNLFVEYGFTKEEINLLKSRFSQLVIEIQNR